MLIVLLIIMVATAAATVSVSSTQSEMQATGQERIALQTRYVAETAIVATEAWLNGIGNAGFEQFWNNWTAAGAAAPDMSHYPEPPYAAGTAARATMLEQRALSLVAASEVPALTGEMVDDGDPATWEDPVGAFGPNQAYALPADTGYVVDFVECPLAPAAMTPGSPLGGGPGAARAHICTVTARGRLEVATDERQWTIGATNFAQRVFASAHDSRAVVLTPEGL